jgi:hypothetical protein
MLISGLLARIKVGAALLFASHILATGSAFAADPAATAGEPAAYASATDVAPTDSPACACEVAQNLRLLFDTWMRIA